MRLPITGPLTPLHVADGTAFNTFTTFQDISPVPQLVIPQLFEDTFPAWFAGIAFAAIAIGALVPAAIMSIAAANLYTRNIHREFVNKNPTEREESQIAKWVSLVVKFGAMAEL